MSKTKFTPGPWEYGENPAGFATNEIVVRPQGEFPHGLWIADCGPRSAPQRHANARLIAAAPEMYKALKTIQEFYDCDYPVSEPEALRDIADTVGDVRALLAKVEGS